MATITCPNCGGENNVNGREVKECTYCGTALSIPTQKKTTQSGKSKQTIPALSKEKFIIPLDSKYSTQEGVMAALRVAFLNTKDIPVDLFDYLEIKFVKWSYVPMWRYGGKIDTEWSCDEVVFKERAVGDHPVYDSNGRYVRTNVDFETYEDFIPRSGKGHTTFDTLYLATRGKMNGIERYSASINLYQDDLVNAIPFKNKAVIIPASAEVEEVDYKVDSEEVLNELARTIKFQGNHCSFDSYEDCIKEVISTHYELNDDGTVGGLYYVPYVYVIYTYKGETYEWKFARTPDSYIINGPTNEVTEEEIVDELENEVSEELKAVEHKYYFNFGLSFLLALIGSIVFFIRCNLLFERVKKRYENQIRMVSLRNKMVRLNDLSKHGMSKKELAKIKGMYEDDSDEDDEFTEKDDIKPKSVTEIDQYFAETAKLKKKLYHKIRNFWLLLLAMALIVGVCIGSFYYWYDLQSERISEEEYAAYEARRNKLIEEETAKFQAAFVGNAYQGSDQRPIDSKRMKIKFLDGSRLQYQLGKETQEWDGYNQKVKWENPKVASYSIEFGQESTFNNTQEVCYLLFDGYKTSNLYEQYRDHEFAQEFTVPVDKNKPNNLIEDKYYLIKE